jgi:hypothetical protein
MREKVQKSKDSRSGGAATKPSWERRRPAGRALLKSHILVPEVLTLRKAIVIVDVDVDVDGF